MSRKPISMAPLCRRIFESRFDGFRSPFGLTALQHLRPRPAPELDRGGYHHRFSAVWIADLHPPGPALGDQAQSRVRFREGPRVVPIRLCSAVMCTTGYDLFSQRVVGKMHCYSDACEAAGLGFGGSGWCGFCSLLSR